MERQRIQLTEDILIETYPFSDYITCVEVFANGQSFNAFCSDTRVVEEWKENPEMLIQLCEEHMLRQPIRASQQSAQDTERTKLKDGIEVEYYAFSDDVYCINVYKEGKLQTAFCSDLSSLEDWQEDPDALHSMIINLMNGER